MVPVEPFRYTYLGDRWTRPELVGAPCNPVRRPDGRCIVSIRRATALVAFETGARHVVARRRLRLNDKPRRAGEPST